MSLPSTLGFRLSAKPTAIRPRSEVVCCESRSAVGPRIVASVLACWLAVSVSTIAQGEKIFINERWPIKGPGGTVLSPPNVEPTNECAKSVYVDSFIPHATITVFLGGTTVIGGPV